MDKQPAGRKAGAAASFHLEKRCLCWVSWAILSSMFDQRCYLQSTWFLQHTTNSSMCSFSFPVSTLLFCRTERSEMGSKMHSYHRIAWVGRSFSPSHLQQTGKSSTRPGYSWPCPTLPWMFEVWGIYYISGHSVIVFHHPHHKIFSLCI